MTKRILSLLFSFLLAVSGVFAQDFITMLRRADSLASFPGTDFSAEYTVVQDVPGRGRTTTISTVFRRDSEKKYVIVVMEPAASKGQGYLKLDQTLWFYDPQSRKFNSARAGDRFQNSNARNSDFTGSTLAQDYRVVKGEATRLGAYDCWVLDLEAATREITYPFMRIWIDAEGLVRKAEDYSLSRQLLRTTLIPAYQKVGTRYFPRKMLIVENLSGTLVAGTFVNERTQVTIEKPSLRRLPDSVFSKSFLESVSR